MIESLIAECERREQMHRAALEAAHRELPKLEAALAALREGNGNGKVAAPVERAPRPRRGSKHRDVILGYLQEHGPSRAPAIGAAVGLPGTAIYAPLRQLLAAGDVKVKGARGERVWRVSGR